MVADAATDTLTLAGAGTVAITTNASSDTITFTGTAGSFTAAGDSGSSQAIASGNTLTIAGGTGLSSVASATDTITINGDDASTSAKGVAQFSSDNFAASSGTITIKSGGVDLTDEVTGALPGANIANDAISEEHLDNTAVTGFSAETVIAQDDLILISDTSASTALKKMTRENFVQGLSTTGKSLVMGF